MAQANITISISRDEVRAAVAQANAALVKRVREKFGIDLDSASAAFNRLVPFGEVKISQAKPAPAGLYAVAGDKYVPSLGFNGEV